MSEETLKFSKFILENCYILNGCRFQYRGNNYTTEQLFEIFKKL